MAIGDDFTIDYVNKRIWNKYAWGQGGSTTVYAMVAFYSWLMDTFDEQGAMDDYVPMSAQTPNAFTLINEWFIDDETIKYLDDGALVTARGDDVITLLTFQESGYTNCVFSDIGKQVNWDSSDHGALLAYDNTRRVWWVRTSDDIGAPEAITITTGTGAGTATAQDDTGEDLFANIFTIGTIESGTQLYIYQAGSKISGWWSTGHIDVLVKVKEFGTEIDNAVITVCARVYTDTYDFYEADLTAGGRTPIPLATADDIDNQTAIATALDAMKLIKIAHVNATIAYTGGSGTPVLGQVLRGATSGATAYIMGGVSATPFVLGNVEGGPFNSSESLVILSEVPFDGMTVAFTTMGQTITATSGGTGTLRKVVYDPQEDGTSGILYLSGVAGTFADNDTLTGGTEGSATQYGSKTDNSFTATTNGSQTFADTVDLDLDNGNGAQPYNVMIFCGSQTVEVLYELLKGVCRRTSTFLTYPTNGTDTVYTYNGEFYQKADTTYTQLKKASPYGTFAGGKFFGARGIWIQSMAGADSESYSLIDANNVVQNPPTSMSITVTDMIASNDRVLVCESTGSGSYDIKKNQYTLTSQVNQSYIEVSGAIADDAPTTGVVRVVVDYGLATEYEDIYSYTSIDRSGADDRFILAAPTGQTYDSGDRAYNPYIDGNADGSGEASVSVKFASLKYIVTRVRYKGYIPFSVAGSVNSGTNPITAIRTVDGIYQP